MGLMYTCLVFSLAELSSILPTAGGGYGFARRALGTWGGFLTGTAILIEYVLAPAAISIFIGDYVESLGLFGLDVRLAGLPRLLRDLHRRSTCGASARPCASASW